MGCRPARAPWRDCREALFSSPLATRPPHERTAERLDIGGRSKLPPGKDAFCFWPSNGVGCGRTADPAAATLSPGSAVRGPCGLQTLSPGAPTKATPASANATDFEKPPKPEARGKTTLEAAGRCSAGSPARLAARHPHTARGGGSKVPPVLHTLVRINHQFHSFAPEESCYCQEGPSQQRGGGREDE